MTLHYPDISNYQAGVALGGAAAVCIKATEGTGYASPDYGPALGRAHSARSFAFAYHFLRGGDPGGQAAWCLRHVGARAGVMLDFEPSPRAGSFPQMADACGFLDAYHAAGGTCHLTYLPHWYWQQLGSPSLAPLARRAQSLVSSSYTTYTNSPSGAGWQPYGGMTPAIWQHTSTLAFHGKQVDCNAWRGDLAGLTALVLGGHTPPRPPGAPPFPYDAGHYLGQPDPSPSCHSGYYGGPDQVNVHTWQAKMAARGWQVTADGRYGQQSEDAARAFQAEKHLDVDGKVGAATWRATWAAPVSDLGPGAGTSAP